MASQTAIRWRRSIAERHALERVEREIRATDPHSRRKYLRDFSEAFQSYQSVLTADQVDRVLRNTDLLLVGDYHALPASQHFAADILEKLARESGRPVVLALEMVFSRDQHILSEWMRGEIDDAELRERVRFDLDWGYDWAPFLHLLQTARTHAAAAYGLDCMPREDMRRIAARDRHAADKLAEIRQWHPNAMIVVLFGESHLAPNHLPLEVNARLPRDRVFTVLQNVDTLYWRAAGERHDRVHAVQVSDDVVCVFNSTPLEKYESYRLCLDRWSQQRTAAADLAPTIYNLIDALLRFLNIDKYSSHNGTQPRFLVDKLPEVYSRRSPDAIRKILRRRGATDLEIKQVLARLATNGSCYWPRLNAIFVTNFQMVHGGEQAAHFVHHACRGSHLDLHIKDSHVAAVNSIVRNQGNAEDAFYIRVMEEALGYFGSRVLYPARPAIRERDLYPLYAQPREAIEEQTIYSYREYMQMIDFIVMHKDYEANLRAWHNLPPLFQEGLQYQGEKFDFATRTLGHILGGELYDAYIAGRIAKRTLHQLFFRDLDAAGAARSAYFALVRRVQAPRKRLLAA
jgi:Haem-binding uptake, Tiki superfamily, ChaN